MYVHVTLDMSLLSQTFSLLLTKLRQTSTDFVLKKIYIYPAIYSRNPHK